MKMMDPPAAKMDTVNNSKQGDIAATDKPAVLESVSLNHTNSGKSERVTTNQSSANANETSEGTSAKNVANKSQALSSVQQVQNAIKMRMESFKKISDDLERVIEKDDSNSSLTTDSEDGKHVPRTCREKLAHVLHTTKFQIAVIVLVIIDCILVITELLLELKVIQAHESSPAPKVLHFMSISILSIFLIEIALKVFAMRQEFFKSKMEVFDAIVVIVSFALDVAFSNTETAKSGVGLLIILRLWRVVRILNGIVLSVKTQAERRLLKERRIREAIEQELSKYREYCSAQEKEIEALQGLLRKHGIQFDIVERPVMGSRFDVVAEVNTLTDRLGSLEKEKEVTESSS